MRSEFLLAFNQICRDRGLSSEIVLEALEMALVSAYRRSANNGDDQIVTAKVDMETGHAHVFVEKQVVEDVADASREILLENARAIQPDVKVGDSLEVESTPKDFGRIAAQNAKQIILQRIREAEREARYEHYVQQEGEIVHGTVQSVSPQAVELHLEGTEAILPRSQQVQGERYSVHQRLRAYVLEVRKTSRGPQIVVSRSHKNMLRRLLELEVPEIFNGAVEIKSISREAGSRSKVAVAARQPGVDPVGACVGMRGVRIQSIVSELGGEKIDVIEWNPDASVFIAKALSPARVLSVRLDQDPLGGRTANVVVPDDRLSLAIGRAGQNARLAAKLTGWRIDIQGMTEAATWALQRVNEDPNVLPALGIIAEMLPRLANALRKHEEESLPYAEEELLVARQVIDVVWGYYASIRDAERTRLLEEERSRLQAIEAAEAERRAEIEAARATIPPQAYEIPLADIGLSTRVMGHLSRANLETVGEVMGRLAEGDEGLLKLDGFGPKSLSEVKQCIGALALPEAVTEMPGEEVEERAIEAEETVGKEQQAVEEVTLPVEPSAGVPAETELEEPVVEELAVEEPVPAEVEEIEEKPEKVERPETPIRDDDDVFAVDAASKRERRPRRQLVYDEELEMVVARRVRKRDQDVNDEWGDFLE